MTAGEIVAVAAAAIALLALVGCVLLLRRVRGYQTLLDREIERGKAEFDRVVAHETELRADELSKTLARLRADSLSMLAEEERRIADERRRDVAERERDATARLGDLLVDVQRGVEQRLTDWALDVQKLQEGLTEELARVESRQRQLMTEVASRIGQDADGLQGEIDEQRQMIARLRGELAAAAKQVTQEATTEIEQHAAERRRALHEIADRMRKREHDLQQIVDREGNEAAQRIALALGDTERRQLESVQRAVQRETARHVEAAAIQFDTAIRSQREEAARRLGRELELAVERFGREAEVVLTERLNGVSDAAAQRVEERLARLRSALERQRDDAMRSLEERSHQVESDLRGRLQEIASDAESERAILDARLHELARRLDELTTRA